METKHDTRDASKTSEDPKTPVEPAAEQPKELPSVRRSRSKKPWFLAAGLLVIFLTAGITMAVYFLANGPRETDADGATKFASPQALIDEVKYDLKGSVMEVAVSDGLGGITKDGYSVYDPPSYHVAGNDFSNLPNESFGVGYTGDSIQAEDNYKVLTNFFKKHNFKLMDSQENEATAISGDEYAANLVSSAYESRDILCAVWRADASATNLKGHVSSIGCATKESYKEAAKELKPFYAAYTKGEKPSNYELVFGVAEISDGADGYKNAVVYQEDEGQVESSDDTPYFEGLYYKAPGASEWTFFIGSMGGPMPCSDYKTDLLKKAFKGLNCRDTATDQDGKV